MLVDVLMGLISYIRGPTICSVAAQCVSWVLMEWGSVWKPQLPRVASGPSTHKSIIPVYKLFYVFIVFWEQVGWTAGH